jgi:class 3 adenylate cyclase
VDKFAGDAVMATFNVAGSRVVHAVLALEAALALRGQGRADRSPGRDRDRGRPGRVLADRRRRECQRHRRGDEPGRSAAAAAAGGEILLSDEAFRRVSSWLTERGLAVEPQKLELLGFDGANPAYRLRASVPIAAV